MSNDLTKDVRELLETGFENAYPVALNRSNLVKDAYGNGAEVILSNGHLKLKTYKNGDPVPIGVKDGVIAKADDGSDDILIAKDGIWVNKSGGGSSGVSSFNGRDGQVTLEEDDVLDALGYTPESSDNRDVAGGYVGFDSSKRIKLGRSINAQVRTLDVGGHINFDTVPNLSVAQMNTMTLTAINVGTGNIATGTYHYGVSFVTAEGETGSPDSLTGLNSIVLSSSSNVRLSSIPVSSDPRVTGRKIYRSQVSGQLYPLKLIGTINNNTTTTFDDTLANDTTITDSFYNKPNTTSGRLYFENIKVFESNIYNTAIGVSSLQNNISAINSVAIGSGALRDNISGDGNTAIGNNSLVTDLTGKYNTAVGYSSQHFKYYGDSNTSVGYQSLKCATNDKTFSHNVAIGIDSLRNLLNNNLGNTAIGSYSGSGSQGNSSSHGRYNVYVGYMTGYKDIPADSGRYNIAIGNNCGKALNTDSNIIIGNTVESPLSENGVINIGNVLYGRGCASGSTPSSTAKVGIGKTPLATLDVAGDAIFDGYVAMKDSAEVNGDLIVNGEASASNLSGSNTGDETSARMALIINNETVRTKDTIIDADKIAISKGDSSGMSSITHSEYKRNLEGVFKNTDVVTNLTGDVTLTTALTEYDVATLSLTAGTWLVNISIESYINLSTSRDDILYVKTGASTYIRAFRSRVPGYGNNLCASLVLTVAGSTTLTFSMISSAGNVLVKRYCSYTAKGSTIPATQFNAIKLY